MWKAGDQVPHIGVNVVVVDDRLLIKALTKVKDPNVNGMETATKFVLQKNSELSV